MTLYIFFKLLSAIKCDSPRVARAQVSFSNEVLLFRVSSRLLGN